MKAINHIIILLLCFSLLCGCGSNKTTGNLADTANTVAEATDEAALTDTTTVATYSDEQMEALENPDELSVGDTFTVENQLFVIGSIKYTIAAARIIAPEDDAGLDIGNFEEYTYVKTEPFTYYPDYLTDDGRLADGCYLVQLDVHVENIDAIGDGDMYSDTTLLRADCIQLDNREYADDESESVQVVTAHSPDYFTGLNEFEEHPYLFRLEPGQSTDYTIGYLANEEWAVQDAASLLATISGSNGSFEVNLNLGDGA